MSSRKSRAAAAPRTAPAAAPAAPRRVLWVSLALALVGLGLSVWLARLHVRAHAGESSFCAINEVINCDRVATSPYSVVLGLPVAVWGAFGYGLAALLAGWGVTRRRPHPAWPAGLLFLVAALAVAASIALAIVSEALIGAWCLMCVASWATAAALLGTSWRAVRAPGVGAAVRVELGAIRASPLGPALLGAAALLALAVTAALYPRYWNRPPRPASAAAPGPRPGGPGTPAVTGPAGEPVIVVYSDYECPFCAKAHEDARALLAGRTDVQLVRRQFPLDPSCNPLVKRQIHQDACALARAGICAEAQGKLPAMEDLLFANQRAHRPIRDLAHEVGLDLAAFDACLVAPATDARLASDIAAGARDGIRATPTYVIRGVSYAGTLPPSAVPPPRAASR